MTKQDASKTLQEIVPITATPFTTQSGETYLFPRPWLAFWTKFNEFYGHAAQLQAMMTEMTDAQAVEAAMNWLGEVQVFLEYWLNEKARVKGQPLPYTEEAIEMDFTLADVPGVMHIAAQYTAEVFTAQSPLSPDARPNRAQRRASSRKKQTGPKS